MSLIPPNFQTLVSLIGFTADRENAIKEFEECLSIGGPRVKFIHIWNNLIKGD